MDKRADTLWRLLNASRYECKICRFKSFNKAHWRRHFDSDKHFLLTTFRDECPRDLKIMVASFLPLRKLIRLEHVGRLALTHAWQRPLRYRYLPRMVLPHLFCGRPQLVGDLPVRTAGGVILGAYSGRNLAYVLTV
jgi:hypothetical protein